MQKGCGFFLQFYWSRASCCMSSILLINKELQYVNYFQEGHREVPRFKQQHIHLVTALLLWQDHGLVSLSHLCWRCHNLQHNVESHGARWLVKVLCAAMPESSRRTADNESEKEKATQRPSGIWDIQILNMFDKIKVKDYKKVPHKETQIII